MEGYDLISSDDKKVGTVVGERNGYVIVEEGLLRKSRHAVPRTFVSVDESHGVVRASITRDILTSSPALDHDEIDEQAVALHYGLAAGEEAPETKGHGDLLPDDPAWSAEQQERRAGIETATEERARIRERSGGSVDAPPTSPGVTGGDRARDVPDYK